MVELIMIFILVVSVFFGILMMGEGGLKEALGVVGLLLVYTAVYLWVFLLAF